MSKVSSIQGKDKDSGETGVSTRARVRQET